MAPLLKLKDKIEMTKKQKTTLALTLLLGTLIGVLSGNLGLWLSLGLAIYADLSQILSFRNKVEEMKL